jgi:DNA-binding transcriptional regulator YdaS (Cro superfamily)
MRKSKTKKPGPAIHKYLKKNNLSQRELAEKLGVSQGLISQWLTGRARPTPEMTPLIEHVTKGQLTREHLFPEMYGRSYRLRMKESATVK